MPRILAPTRTCTRYEPGRPAAGIPRPTHSPTLCSLPGKSACYAFSPKRLSPGCDEFRRSNSSRYNTGLLRTFVTGGIGYWPIGLVGKAYCTGKMNCTYHQINSNSAS